MPPMAIQLLVAGGGIGGLAAATACARAGNAVTVLEQAAAFSETGAGIQLGPNATRILQHWGLGAALRERAAQPQAVVVRDGGNGRELARLALGTAFEQRYGAPYLTVHRADLQQVLLDAAHAAGAALRVDARVDSVETDTRVHVRLAGAGLAQADAVVAADGVWSSLRHHVVADGAARPTGHFAYRALALQSSLPAALRRDGVTVWLAPRMHVVAYPVRGGDQLNVVALVEAPGRLPAQGWDAMGADTELLQALHGVCCELRELVDAMPGWGVWSLHDRAPVRGPQEMARGRIALLGDAAHPMLPYLAQGAGMAIEDANTLGSELADSTPRAAPGALARYADARWQRCALVQSRARRNANVFHADGLVRIGRDLAMKVRGGKLLDQPWLYGR